jgi:hypothetical protein
MMRFLFGLIRLLAFFVLLLLLIAVFLPSDAHIERSLIIKTVPEVPYNLINRLEDWEKWSPWHQLDPKMKIQYEGPPEGNGASYSWKSDHDKVGNGKLRIAASRPYDYILMDMDFGEGGPARCGFYFQKTDEGTEVKWTIDTDAGWNLPGRYFILLMDYFVGPHFEDGLANLAELSGKIAKRGYTMSLEPSDFAGMNVVYIDVSCTEEEILRVPAVMHAKIISSLPEMDVTMTGPLLVMREGKIGNLLQMKAGIPVSAKPKAALTDGMKIMQLPPGRIMLARMNGLPSVISPAFPEMKKEILKWKLKPSGSPWECYISELNNRKDPLENRMEIYWPVQ